MIMSVEVAQRGDDCAARSRHIYPPFSEFVAISTNDHETF